MLRVMLCFIIFVITSVCLPVLAEPQNTPFLKVDLNGDNGPTQAGWESWSFERFPTVNTFNNTFGNVGVTITGINYEGVLPQSRNREEPPEENNEYLNNVYRDFLYIPRSTSAGFGLDYLKIDFSGLNANTYYEFTVFDFDAYYIPESTKYMAWGIENPANYPSYEPTVGGGGLAPKLARLHTAGADPCDPSVLDPYYYSGSFFVRTNENGQATIYGWADNESWEGSQHAPLNGFAIGIPEPGTMALLGIGILALRRRKQR
ncbi:MAG: PEP-CTERM sorting domain-containing protein [Sedimentisphaerales bacterium]|nr:PEP-CTERM sorting domain-containing protein [Sedimentisphaerales bacterium]